MPHRGVMSLLNRMPIPPLALRSTILELRTGSSGVITVDPTGPPFVITVLNSAAPSPNMYEDMARLLPPLPAVKDAPGAGNAELPPSGLVANMPPPWNSTSHGRELSGPSELAAAAFFGGTAKPGVPG